MNEWMNEQQEEDEYSDVGSVAGSKISHLLRSLEFYSRICIS